MKNKLLIIMGPNEDDLIPAIDSAIRQIANGILGLRKEENKKKIKKLSSQADLVEALIFARDFGFCARVFLELKLYSRSRLPKGMRDMETEVKSGFVKIKREKTRLHYPIDATLSGGTLEEIHNLFDEEKLREIVKEGMTVVDDINIWSNCEAILEQSAIEDPQDGYSFNQIFESKPGEKKRIIIDKLERFIHSKRVSNKNKWAYQNTELYNAIVEDLENFDEKDREQLDFEFIAGLCAYHLGKYNKAVEHLRQVYLSEKNSIYWINQALARSLYKAEDKRDYKGRDEFVYHLYTKILQAAKSKSPILITGERGTGKELVVKEIHRYSDREKLEIINIGSLSGDIVDSELFGHEIGAFTGALRSRKGAFQRAGAGILFIDEIGNASLEVQMKLLRVIEYGKYYRVGGDEEIESKAKIIFATNKNLWELAKAGSFMEDLLDRINTFHIELEPLRVRKKNTDIIIPYIKKELPDVMIGTDAQEELRKYGWRGNFRELKAFIERIEGSNIKYIFQEELQDLLFSLKGTRTTSLSGVNYEINKISEFRKNFNELKKEEIRKYACYQYLKNGNDWTKMLKSISDKYWHNTKDSLKKMSLTEDNVDKASKRYFPKESLVSGG